MLGGLTFGALGLTLPDVLRSHEVQPHSPRAKSCIYIFLNGGASHIDMWDMKPDAPVEVRGEFKSISTSVPGIDFCEHLPLLAAQAHHLALVRSLEMPGVQNSHPWGYCYMLTGHPPDPSRYQGEQLEPRPTDWPFLGSVASARLPARQGPAALHLPRAIQLPWIWDQMANQFYVGGFAGRLGRTYDPFLVGFDKETTSFASASELFQPQPSPQWRWQSVAIPDLTLPGGMDPRRFDTRRELLSRVERFEASRDGADAAGYDRYQDQAFSLLTSPEAKRALDLEQESPDVRDRYGPSINGQCALLCRRLVEAGVPFINFQWLAPREYYYNWDTHQQNFRALAEYLLPPFDRAISTLLSDLDQRGLLAETLVVIGSDMGRNPRVGDALSPSGRNHWNFCQTALLAGAGIRGAAVYGSSDKIAAYPKDNPVRPEHIAATVYDALGIYGDLWARDALGRPYHLLEEGHPLPLTG
jgi:hypothetical protein